MVSHAYHASLIRTLGRHVAILLTVVATPGPSLNQSLGEGGGGGGGLDFRVLLG